MKFRHFFSVLAALLILLPGCALIDGSDEGVSVRFRAAQNFYEPVIFTGIAVFMNFEIATRLENTGDEDIALLGCLRPSYPVLQKLVDNEWEFVYGVAEPECLSPPFILGPGDVYRDTLRIHAILDPDLNPAPKWANGIPVDGNYRLHRNVYNARFEDDFPSELLPVPLRVTQNFEIRARQALTRSVEPAAN